MRSITVNLENQKLILTDDEARQEWVYPISSGTAGNGEQMGSNQTPRGMHRIRAKIGEGMPANTVFVARRPTGELYTPDMSVAYPDRDWILTRILWLCGCEVGKNRLGNVDTMRRYIYIHGVPDEADFSFRRSKGCINMHNGDIIDLFERVPVGTLVNIIE